jgi:hypothetical protein
VNAAEWETAGVEALLRHVPERDGRKLRLFACACCRSIGPLLTDERCRLAVGVAESFANGTATREALAAASVSVAAALVASLAPATRAAGWAVGWTALEGSACGQAWAVKAARRGAAAAVEARDTRGAKAAERRKQADLFRCIFGNPFLPAPAFDPIWLGWEGGTVKRLAEAIRAERAFSRLAVLADALEEAGCRDPAILAHCRRPHHALGCWVLAGLLAD